MAHGTFALVLNRPPPDGWQRPEAGLEIGELAFEPFAAGNAGPELPDARARDALAQIGIAFPGEALLRPGNAETVVTITLVAAGQENAIGMMARDDEIEKGWRQHGDTRKPQYRDSGAPQSLQFGTPVAAVHEDACISAQASRRRQRLVTQVLNPQTRQIDTGDESGRAPEGRGGRAGAHANAATGAQLIR